MVGYMSGSKKARSTPSITNNTNIFGLMGGLAPRVGTSDVAVYRHKIIKGGRGLPELNGKTPEQQQYYMKVNKLLSVNPAGSGGVGKMSNSYHFSCNCSMGSTNQSLVLGNEFSQYVNSMNSTELLDTAHTATPATNNLVFGLRNSSVKFTSPIMKQEAIGFSSQCYNVGSDLNVDVQIPVSHDDPPNSNHTAEIQHDKAIAFIKKYIGNYNHKGKPLSEYGIDITGNVDSNFEYGWNFTMKKVNISISTYHSVKIQVFVSNENDADTPGPVYLMVEELNQDHPSMGFKYCSLSNNNSIIDNGLTLSLNDGKKYDKGGSSTDTFDIFSSQHHSFKIMLSMGTDNGINIEKIIITYNNHKNTFECNDEDSNPLSDTVGWIDANSPDVHPWNRTYTINFNGSTIPRCD